ncbi:hypothetical protein FT643_11055 [Ketobacter sp. MCCC 1A13808]|uniref:hypothetical protein n=1 Tax=Ketobacter sp. MCCC 1A13808 TaxID=2602738 RepID=UPI000F24F86B|nr:hypothetical protein [Ketobacter sp. MCCC 1A13808]MVF12679.1 hypothetical protein [Ketobacter sp. MCCC 1A13808]RLP55526.1 MAG: hypothetical protein D6160_03730 [Ketobacter sp.]
MGINPLDFRKLIIRPTLQKLGKWTLSLENLLLGSAAQASQLGIQLQFEFGIGVYRINRELHQKVWDEYFAFDPDLASMVRGFASQREFLSDPDMELTMNLAYATAIAWGVYARSRAQIPEDADNIEALANCWFQHFCCDSRLSPQHFIDSYRQLQLTDEKPIAA